MNQHTPETELRKHKTPVMVEQARNKYAVLLISNFCHVLKVVCFLLSNSSASEFYMPAFRNTLSVPSS